ncbi:hypothetical protein lerEdw1_011400 [Lerista edwardsae]|nr:hypothetical protein lerEdw1_011400 [Lerista edwardsae]
MAAEPAAAAHRALQFPAAQEQGLQLQIKVEEEEKEEKEERRMARGLHVAFQARSLRDILGWPEPVKQEPEEELPQCWEGQAQEHLKLVPLLLGEMGLSSPEAELTLLDRRRFLRREAKQGLEREAGSLACTGIRQMSWSCQPLQGLAPPSLSALMSNL